MPPAAMMALMVGTMRSMRVASVTCRRRPDVEVGAQQHALASEIEVVERLETGHESYPRSSELAVEAIAKDGGAEQGIADGEVEVGAEQEAGIADARPGADADAAVHGAIFDQEHGGEAERGQQQPLRQVRGARQDAAAEAGRGQQAFDIAHGVPCSR